MVSWCLIQSRSVSIYWFNIGCLTLPSPSFTTYGEDLVLGEGKEKKRGVPKDLTLTTLLSRTRYVFFHYRILITSLFSNRVFSNRKTVGIFCPSRRTSDDYTFSLCTGKTNLVTITPRDNINDIEIGSLTSFERG